MATTSEMCKPSPAERQTIEHLLKQLFSRRLYVLYAHL